MSYFDKIKSEICCCLNRYNIEYEICYFSDGLKLIDNICSYNIVFLDVEMDVLNGLQIKNIISHYRGIRIVFVSNYEQYMSEAYGVNVVGYVSKKKLSRIQDVLNMIISDDAEHMYIQIDGNQVDTFDIIYIQADGSYSNIFLIQKKIYLCAYLKNILDRLPDNFIRVHRSYVINMRYIKTFENDVITLGNEKIPLSRKYKNDFIRKYYDYLRGKI